MKKDMDNGMNSYLIMNQDGFMDISSGRALDSQPIYSDGYGSASDENAFGQGGDNDLPPDIANIDAEYDTVMGNTSGKRRGRSKESKKEMRDANSVPDKWEGISGYEGFQRKRGKSAGHIDDRGVGRGMGKGYRGRREAYCKRSEYTGISSRKGAAPYC